MDDWTEMVQEINSWRCRGVDLLYYETKEKDEKKLQIVPRRVLLKVKKERKKRFY